MGEFDAYRKFTGKAEFEKAINSLLGLIEGIAIDSKINHQEIHFLTAWLDDHRINSGKHPFNELFPVVEQAVSDGVLTEDEKANILWLCKRMTSSDYFDSATADLQKLHALIAGIASDGEISVEELKGLSEWVQDHDHLKRRWPYDEIESLITSTLADKRIDAEEHKGLMRFFGEFVSLYDSKTIVRPVLLEGSNLVGVCAMCPEITFANAVFCFSGLSSKFTRDDFELLVSNLGARAVNRISKKVHYLVVGADGNPCWAYACYGRKIEEAIELRKAGHPIVIVHENDFHDAVADL